MINILINSGKSFFSLRKSFVEYLLHHQHSIRILTPNNKLQIKKNFPSNRVKIELYKLYNNKKSTITLIKNIFSLFYIFKGYKQNTNIIFGSYLILIFGVISFLIPFKKNIYVFTGLGSYFNYQNKLNIFLVKLIFNIILTKKNSFFVFYNSADRNFLINKKLYNKSKIIMGSGIDIKRKVFKKKIKKNINFLYYSRFNSDKGLLDLIKAIDIVNSSRFGKKCKFFFYGLFDENPSKISRKFLKKKISKFKNVFLKETEYEKNLDNIFLRKHVFILPSHREGLPKSVLEAMNFNCALILSNIPGHKFLINRKKVNGLYFETKNEIDLSKKIIWMIQNKNKITEYSQNSKKNLSKFSSNKVNKLLYETI